MKTMLSPVEFKVLALVLQEQTGRNVAHLFRRQTGEQIPHGSLYSALRRMRERGWVRMRKDRALDPRIRLFVATMDGVRELDRARGHYAKLAAFGLV